MHACGCRRLGLEVVVRGFCGFFCTPTSPVLPSDIVTYEQVLNVLAGAMRNASEPEAGFDYITDMNGVKLLKKRE